MRRLLCALALARARRGPASCPATRSRLSLAPALDRLRHLVRCQGWSGLQATVGPWGVSRDTFSHRESRDPVLAFEVFKNS